MTIKQAKTIPLTDYLLSLGFKPIRRSGRNLLYLSPYRNERNPSFAVNPDDNTWYDYGTGCGGKIIELAMKLYQTTDISAVLHCIEQNASVILPPSIAMPPHPCQIKPSLTNLQVIDLQHPSLLAYLHKRCISLSIAMSECKELHYRCNGKPYFGIGFPNVKGGWECRNPFFKGCFSPKGISIVECDESTGLCCVFEGFTDYLSFLTMNAANLSANFVVLNSVALLDKAMDYIAQHKKLLLFMDNDAAGRNAYSKLQSQLDKHSIVDITGVYMSLCKDVNDYLNTGGMIPTKIFQHIINIKD